MTRSTVKRLTKPLDEPKREFRRLRRAALQSHQNESLAIAGRKKEERNLFDERSIYDDRRKLDQFAQFRFQSLTEEEGWNRIEEYVQYQDDLRDDMSPPMNISSISKAMRRGRLKRTCNQISYLETPTREVGLKNPYLICDYYGGSYEADECKQTSQVEQTSNLPFPSRLKKQKKDDKDERLLSIFNQIHINLPFLEAMIHMPKGAKILKDLLSHKEKLKKVASPVKLSEKCFAIIQRKPMEPLEWKALEIRLKPSSVEPPKLELKELPEHLEYAFLQENNQLPMVILSALSTNKKTRLLEEVVKKEVIKHLDAGLIYPISDSPWVSLVQVVPKKGGMTVVKNEKDELIPQWTVTGWRIRDKKGVENLAADHLSRLENPDLGKLTRADIRDLFPEERLMAISNKNN
ncbi:hypothetical protein Tco_0476012 [Tanacetum coccineum]